MNTFYDIFAHGRKFYKDILKIFRQSRIILTILLSLFPETGECDFEDAIKKNIDIKFDLLNIISPATGYQLGCYIYDLILQIKNDLYY